MIRILENGVAVIAGDSHHGQWMEYEGLVHDKFTAGHVCKHIRPGTVAVDGGAHFGSIALPMLQAGAEVFAFEPSSESADCLRHNCKAFAHKLHVFERGLSKTFGFARIEIAQDQPDNHGARYLVPDQEGDVMLVPLDGIITSEVSVIKLDIEGYELNALQGAPETIKQWRPVIICEVNEKALNRLNYTPEQLFAYLDSINYGYSILQPDCKMGDPQFDLLCRPK